MTSDPVIDYTATVEQVKNVFSAMVDGEAAIFSTERGRYYSLNATGTLIWTLIQEPCSVGSLYTDLQSRYDLAPEVCQRDVTDLLRLMESEGLIHITGCQS